MEKKELINKFAEKGYLLAPELLPSLESEKEENVSAFLDFVEKKEEKPLILTSELFLLTKGFKGLGGVLVVQEIQGKLKVEDAEQEVKQTQKAESGVLKLISLGDKAQEKVREKAQEKAQERASERKVNSIRIIYSYNNEPKKIGVDDFVNYFRNRYSRIRDMLSSKPELDKLVSINKISGREELSVIGMVQEKRVTKNGNVFLVLEDLTGGVKVIVSSRNKELFDMAENLSHDEIIGVKGRMSNQFFFANEIVQAEYFGKEKKKGGNGYALFISDVHIGSNKFMEKEFKSFIRWLNLETDAKNREIAEGCKYLLVLGDLVDGIGVYPGQERELLMKDLHEQYDEAAYLLSQIRDDIKMIIIPGNHDATREAIPQPVFDEKYAGSLFKLKNALILSNPAYVNIGSDENFKGYDVLMYHGHSLNYFANNVKSLVNKGYKDPKLLLTYLLKRRHLAPTHGSTPYIPLEVDPLVVDRIPDVFATGELHKLSATYYNNTALLTCSTWQAKTPYQAKVGHEPDPCKVPVLDLKNNTLKILDFS